MGDGNPLLDLAMSPPGQYEYDSSPLRQWKPEPFAPARRYGVPPFADQYPDMIGLDPHPSTHAIQELAQYMRKLNARLAAPIQSEGQTIPRSQEMTDALSGRLDPKTPDWAPFRPESDGRPVSRMPTLTPDILDWLRAAKDPTRPFAVEQALAKFRMR